MDLFFDHNQTSVLWIALFVMLLARAWFGKTLVAGLGICHLFNLAIIHFFTEFFVGDSNELSLVDRLVGQNGYKVTGIAILGLIIAFLCTQIFKRFIWDPQKYKASSKTQYLPNENIPLLAVLYGLITYFILTRVLSFIPSITSILSSGLALATTGISAFYFIIFKKYGPVSALAASSLSVFFPIFTLLLGGFMGFGVFAVLSLLCFMIAFHKPRWQIVLVTPFVFFMGLSLYPSYMKARVDIRKKVWGESDYSERVSATLEGLLENWQWFDPTDPDQLVSMNDRLNQNILVGYSYDYLRGGSAEFANGETLMNGVLALIPRFIWTDKNIKAGSGQMVTKYAGIVVPESTSIGIGNVMELYINFGLNGVFFGFFIIGTAIYWFDEISGVALEINNFQLFFLFFIMAQSFMNVIGSFVEWGPSLVGGYLLTLLFNKFGFKINMDNQAV